jgi:hypothetical protein
MPRLTLVPMISSQMMSPSPQRRNMTLSEILMSNLQLESLAQDFQSPSADSERSIGNPLSIWYHPSIRALIRDTMAPRHGYPPGYRCARTP